MTVLLVCLIVPLVFAVSLPWAAAHYVSRLPYAPECPLCGAVTADAVRTGVLDRVCAAVATTPVRRCARCGWAGRMRWRLAAERAGTGPRA